MPQKRLRKAQQGGWRRSCSSRKPLLESKGSEARRCEMTGKPKGVCTGEGPLNGFRHAQTPRKPPCYLDARKVLMMLMQRFYHAFLPVLHNVYSWFRESCDAVPAVRCNGENDVPTGQPSQAWPLSAKLLRPEAQEDEHICTSLMDSSNNSWHPGAHRVTKPIQLDAVCFTVRIAQ